MKPVFLLTVAYVLFVASASTASGQCSDPGCTSCAQTAMPAPAVASCGCGDTACTSCQSVVASAPCGCNRAGCGKCGQRLRESLGSRKRCGGGCTQCPKCEGDVCELKLDNGKVKKTCFKTEQKSVCVPPVRMPWQKCCPPGKSKTRLVTVLKKHTYECENCSYKWSVQKAESAPTPAASSQSPQPTPVFDSYITEPGINSTTPTQTFIPNQIQPTQLAPQQNVVPLPQQNGVPRTNLVPRTNVVPQDNVLPQGTVTPQKPVSGVQTTRRPWLVQNNS